MRFHILASTGLASMRESVLGDADLGCVARDVTQTAIRRSA
jgi:hypothetical protein